MSLRDKIAEIKQADKAKIDGEKIKKGKETISIIGSEKEALATKIKDLKELVAKLENSYSAAKTGIAEFKDAKGKIDEIFSDYVAHVEETGAEQKISGVSEILNNEEFADEEEVKEYHKKGTKKIKGNKETGELGDKVRETTQAKAAIKKALPDMELDFRGAKKEGEEMSPREASLLKLKNYIKELEQQELAAVRKKEAEIKGEYLPKIKEIVARNLDRMFPEGKAYSVSSLDSNFNFISDEIFEFCGDELWPEAKEIAIELIRQQYVKKGISFRHDEVSKNLEAEKIIYDVKDLRNKHESLLKLDRDRENTDNLFNYGIRHDLFNRRQAGEESVIKNGKIYPNSILKEIERFKGKNPEAQAACQAAKDSLTNLLTTSKNEITVGFFDGGQTKKDKKTVSDRLQETIEKLNRINIPENFYRNIYEFSNSLSNAKPYIRDYGFEKYSWYKDLKDKIEKHWDTEMTKVKVLQDAEDRNSSKLSNDIYSLRSGFDSVKEDGFEIPVLFVNKQYYYNQIVDKKTVDSFLESISGKALSEDELEAAFKKEHEAMSAEINKYPNAEEILKRFKMLVDKYDKEFNYESRLIDTKVKSRNNPNYRSNEKNDSYKVKNELFYL